MRLVFPHIEMTGESEAQIRRRAKILQRAMEKRFGKGEYPMQDAIHGVIDGLIEWSQGNPA